MPRQKLNLKAAGDPKKAAKQSGLRYVHDDIPGVTRRASGKGFAYYGTDGSLIRNRDVLRRIRGLAIPPAWTEVWICPYPEGHIQATGRDAKGRKQYRYHPRWREVRDMTKYSRMIAFGEALPRLRERIADDLRLRGLPKRKVIAAVVALLARTRIRVGNEEYRKTNRSYGLTTLRDQHVDIDQSRLQFRFRGKSGMVHHISLSDRRLAQVVRRCQDLPGQELFQYLDDEDGRQPVDSGDVNDYVKEATGDDFTSKDFRTWAGTLEVARKLQQLGPAGSLTEAKRNTVEAVKGAAECLGNRPATCRKHYVHPAVIDAYLEGRPMELPCRNNGRDDDILSEGAEEERDVLLRFLRRCEKRLVEEQGNCRPGKT